MMSQQNVAKLQRMNLLYFTRRIFRRLLHKQKRSRSIFFMTAFMSFRFGWVNNWMLDSFREIIEVVSKTKPSTFYVFKLRSLPTLFSRIRFIDKAFICTRLLFRPSILFVHDLFRFSLRQKFYGWSFISIKSPLPELVSELPKWSASFPLITFSVNLYFALSSHLNVFSQTRNFRFSSRNIKVGRKMRNLTRSSL